MKFTQHIICKSFFALILLFAGYGCQTTNNTITSEQSVSSLNSDSIITDTKNAEHSILQTSPVEKEVTATNKQTELDEEHIEKLQEKLGSILRGHGGLRKDIPEDRNTATTKDLTEYAAVKPDEIENRPFIELEKKMYGKWMNLKETESFEFLDEGTIIIIDKSGRNPRLKGNYKFVEKDRLKIYFEGGLFASMLPTRHFKFSLSENEFTLTDEPDGPATKYKRIK